MSKQILKDKHYTEMSNFKTQNNFTTANNFNQNILNKVPLFESN